MKMIDTIKESYNELVHKVSWPSGSELSNSAVVVMFASLLMALVILGMDSGFEFVMRHLYEMMA